MTRSTRRHPSFDLRVLALVASTLVGCATTDTPDGDGTLRVGLWGQGGSGSTYRLVDAGFHITGNGVDAIVSAADAPDGTPSLSVPLGKGDYELELLSGWEVYRGSIGDGDPALVEADLLTDNPVLFTVADGASTDVTYTFEIEGDIVPLADGTLDIDVEFEEDDGVCTPGGHEWLGETGDGSNPVGNGEGWQSFIAPRDTFLAFIPIFWEAGVPTDSLTINVYEGVGTSGTLLSTGMYGAFDSATTGFHWFGNIPILLTEGHSYTIEGVGAHGWRTESGALPGATSSEGDNYHKTMQLHGMICD
jgi:hypothetical protein